jgi:hypothetical protein
MWGVLRGRLWRWRLAAHAGLDWLDRARLAARGLVRRRPVVGDAKVVVNLTTYGHRARRVHLTIESIARGAVRPQRLILWLDDEALFRQPPATLRRLQARGLELQLTRNFGPHTKYFPWVCSEAVHSLPFVTADDDVVYPSDWLAGLLRAHAAEPELVHCYRARLIRMSPEGLAPYASWPLVEDTQASHAHFLTGVSGVIYPAGFAQLLKTHGDGFLNCCPRQDDIWLNAWALRAGVRVRQVHAKAWQLPTLPGTQDAGLFHENQLGGANDAALRATLGPADVAAIALASKGLGGTRSARAVASASSAP